MPAEPQVASEVLQFHIVLLNIEQGAWTVLASYAWLPLCWMAVRDFFIHSHDRFKAVLWKFLSEIARSVDQPSRRRWRNRRIWRVLQNRQQDRVNPTDALSNPQSLLAVAWALPRLPLHSYQAYSLAWECLHLPVSRVRSCQAC